MIALAAVSLVALLLALAAPTRPQPRHLALHENVPAASEARARRARWPTTLMRRAATVAVCLLGLIGAPLLAAIGVATLLLARRARPIVAARQRQRLIDEARPDTIELLVLTIHAGLTPAQAVRELCTAAPSPTRAGFVDVVSRIERGETLADAVRQLPIRLGAGMHHVADVLASAERYGVPIAAALDSLSSEARSARRRHNEADARRLPVRLAFPLVTCTLPSFVLIAIAPAIIAAVSSLTLSP